MSASIYWRPVIPKEGKRLGTFSPNAFLKSIEDTFGSTIPIFLERSHIPMASVAQFEPNPQHFLYENFKPCLFMTRREAREYIKCRYGYIKHRKDLRIEPHGWRLPKPVRVEVILRKI